MKGGKPNEPIDKVSLRLNQFLEERNEKKEDLKLIEEVKKKGGKKAVISNKK